MDNGCTYVSIFSVCIYMQQFPWLIIHDLEMKKPPTFSNLLKEKYVKIISLLILYILLLSFSFVYYCLALLDNKMKTVNVTCLQWFIVYPMYFAYFCPSYLGFLYLMRHLKYFCVFSTCPLLNFTYYYSFFFEIDDKKYQSFIPC